MNTRTLLLIGLTLLAVLAALLLPAVPQPIAYHGFADQRAYYGLPNFLDVASNLAFTLAGAAGVWLVLRRKSCFASPAERWPYLVFCIGVLLTSLGSCYYHLEPNNETLFWDRLPMTIAFMALICAQIVDRVDVRYGLRALVPMLLIGIGTVVYWIVTERQGHGNVMPYVVLQGYAVIVLLKLAAMHPSRYTHAGAIYVVFAAYVLAKVFEHYDAQIFELTGMVSGHTLKHLVAGIAGIPVAWMLWRRQLVAPASAGVAARVSGSRASA